MCGPPLLGLAVFVDSILIFYLSGFMKHLLGFSSETSTEAGGGFGGLGSTSCSHHKVSGIALKELRRKQDHMALC